jgi:hypothetical protein
VCWRWPNWVFWISLLAVLTLADLEGSLKLCVLVDKEEADVRAIVQKDKFCVLGEIKTIKVLSKTLKEKGLDIFLERLG